MGTLFSLSYLEAINRRLSEYHKKPLKKYFDTEDVVTRKLSSREFEKTKRTQMEVFKSQFGRLQLGYEHFFNELTVDSDLNFNVMKSEGASWLKIEQKEKKRSLEKMAVNAHNTFITYYENGEGVLPVLDSLIEEINWTFPDDSVLLNAEFIDEIEKYIQATHYRVNDEIVEIFDDRTGCELYTDIDYAKEKVAEFLVLNYQLICLSVAGTLENRDLIPNQSILLETGIDERMSELFEDFFTYITSTDVDIVIDFQKFVTSCTKDGTDSDIHLKEGFATILEERMKNPVMMERSHNAPQILAIFNNEGREKNAILLKELQMLQDHFPNVNIQVFACPVLRKPLTVSPPS